MTLLESCMATPHSAREGREQDMATRVLVCITELVEYPSESSVRCKKIQSAIPSNWQAHPGKNQRNHIHNGWAVTLVLNRARQTRFIALHQPLAWLVCGHYELFITSKCHIRLANLWHYIYTATKWVCLCLEGDNDSWGRGLGGSRCWCETRNLVCVP